MLISQGFDLSFCIKNKDTVKSVNSRIYQFLAILQVENVRFYSCKKRAHQLWASNSPLVSNITPYELLFKKVS